ncbi:MAG TPA: type III-B CRISPR-associated protein Cas10/Cmr2 [Streptosporangiaceae bacterium]|nr:type III-B CRISPR-associated protein Cas10/Cmr2 [Streptosporangiaceae bacterium]
MDGRGGQDDLVVVALPGVQQFIAEARSTSDVAAASGIYAALAEKVIEAFERRASGTLVLPARPDAEPPARQETAPGLADGDEPGVPNRVVALFPAGTGTGAARQAADAVREAWEGFLKQALSLDATDPVPPTPGFPRVQWVCVPAQPGGYEEQWRKAHQLLAARRRIRDFAATPDEPWRRRALCSLAPRWPAEPAAPAGVRKHDKNTPLSAVGWVKRQWRQGFPSTASIASAPYRQAVLRHLGEPRVGAAVQNLLDAVDRAAKAAPALHRPETPVPGLQPLIQGPGMTEKFVLSGGPWVYPEQWQADPLARQAGLLGTARDPRTERQAQEAVERIRPLAEAGRKAARDLRQVMEELPRSSGVPPLASYLAVLVQDLDSMGLFLSGRVGSGEGRKIEVNPNEHGRVSQYLLRAAAGQRTALRDGTLLGVPVYAGGDDLLAFTPASKALAAAETCHDTIPPSRLPRASTAVLFFHYHASIQLAMSEARKLLDEAKERVPGKHALAVGYLRRSGASEASIQPWPGPGGKSSAELFRIFGRERGQRLSPRLVADLERDADELASLLGDHEAVYQAELARLVRRHVQSGTAGGGNDEDGQAAQALDWLGRHERAPEEAGRAGRVGPRLKDGAARPHVAARVGVFLRQEAR